MLKHKLKLALCQGRHRFPACLDGAVFSEAVNPLDTEELEERAMFVLQDCSALDLYVTGLSVALVAVLNVAKKLGIPVVLWHFNRDNGKYYPQRVED